jgi:hypothetical protein
MMPYEDLSPRLEHAFDIKMFFDQRRLFGPIHGDVRHGYTSVKHGVVSGPRLNGKLVEASGADWPVVRGDGIIELNAHYMLEADDGTQIYIRNMGYVYGSMTPIPSTDNPEGRYFRCTPYFRAPQGPHEWLNRTVVVGCGERRPFVNEGDEPDHSLFRYYAVY